MKFTIGKANFELILTDILNGGLTIKADIPIREFNLSWFTTINTKTNSPLIVHVYMAKGDESA